MKAISINGAVFLFMARGEKLTHQAAGYRDHWPSQRYVLWPRAQWWDVRYLKTKNGMREWSPIADKLFDDESAAWLAAYEHWMTIQEARPKYEPKIPCDTFATLREIE